MDAEPLYRALAIISGAKHNPLCSKGTTRAPDCTPSETHQHAEKSRSENKPTDIVFLGSAGH